MSSRAAIARRIFTLDDQREFARLSGDFNPLHLDANFARRTQMGAPVVHGIHSLLWAVESLLLTAGFDVKNIRVRFQQPLFPNEAAEVAIAGRTDTSIDLDVIAAGTVIVAIKLSAQPGKVSGLQQGSPPVQELPHPRDLPFEQMSGHRGAVTAPASEDDVRKLFPALAEAIGPVTVSGLMATSLIIGMACPGLHSLFAGLDVSIDGSSIGPLGYAVAKTDARFRSLQLDVAGSGLSGWLEAFARPQPPVQPDMNAVAERVAKNVFAGQRALVAGGSRGLGEGGHPVISYREGKAEAEAVAAQIRQAGATCDVIQYDALKPAAEQLAGIGVIDSCYYFATASIFQRKSAVFEPEKLRVFRSYYVDGFSDLCRALPVRASGKVAVFYPSTTALDAETRGMAEYAAAKAAGETLVQQLNASLPNVLTIFRRLPRIVTDQTATVGVATAQDALDVLLPIVHEVQQAARQAAPLSAG
jgi:hypothetical protein